MFTAFQGPPNVVRLYGIGECHEQGSAEYEKLLPIEDRLPSSRAVIVVDIPQVGTSCGWGVPFYLYEKDRTLMDETWSKREALDAAAPDGKAPRGVKKFWATQNFESIDGLPAFEFARKLAYEESEAKGPKSQMVWGEGVFGGLRPHGDGKWVTQLVFILGMFVGVAFSHFIAADRTRHQIEL